jgi:hypothetical protein
LHVQISFTTMTLVSSRFGHLIAGNLRKSAPQGGAPPAPQGAAPPGPTVPTPIQALREQLGWRLERRKKGAIEALAAHRAERPSEN